MSSRESSTVESPVQALRQIALRWARAIQNMLITITVNAPNPCQPIAGWPKV